MPRIGPVSPTQRPRARRRPGWRSRQNVMKMFTQIMMALQWKVTVTAARARRAESLSHGLGRPGRRAQTWPSGGTSGTTSPRRIHSSFRSTVSRSPRPGAGPGRRRLGPAARARACAGGVPEPLAGQPESRRDTLKFLYVIDLHVVSRVVRVAADSPRPPRRGGPRLRLSPGPARPASGRPARADPPVGDCPVSLESASVSDSAWMIGSSLIIRVCQ